MPPRPAPRPCKENGTFLQASRPIAGCRNIPNYRPPGLPASLPTGRRPPGLPAGRQASGLEAGGLPPPFVVPPIQGVVPPALLRKRPGRCIVRVFVDCGGPQNGLHGEPRHILRGAAQELDSSRQDKEPPKGVLYHEPGVGPVGRLQLEEAHRAGNKHCRVGQVPESGPAAPPLIVTCHARPPPDRSHTPHPKLS